MNQPKAGAGTPEIPKATASNSSFKGNNVGANQRKKRPNGHCHYCDEPLVGKRKDALYCDDTCRYNDWAQRNGPTQYRQEKQRDGSAHDQQAPLDDETFRAGLHGVFGKPNPVSQPEIPPEATRAGIWGNDEYMDLTPWIEDLDKKLNGISAEYEKVSSKRENAGVRVGTIDEAVNQLRADIESAGPRVIFVTSDYYDTLMNDPAMQNELRMRWTVIGVYEGSNFERWLKTNHQREVQRVKHWILEQQTAPLIQEREIQMQARCEAFRKMFQLSRQRSESEARRKTCVHHTEKYYAIQYQREQEMLHALYDNSEPEHAKASAHGAGRVSHSDRIIRSTDLENIHFDTLNFQGKWLHFFGRPATTFHLAVHGKPGQGKSTFCVQFADYLARNFGDTIYVSGEEGFSETLKDKLTRSRATSPKLFLSDLRNYDEVITHIPQNAFHFIFIDSLDNMRIDAEQMKQLRKHYQNSALISISQATKDGKMRGSEEIAHEADIVVKVNELVALTTKNRFNAVGREIKVENQPRDT